MKFFLLNLLSLLLASSLFAQKIFFDNNQPRLDTKENIIDAHDGRVIKFGNTYYWYGTRYGNTNGFTNANTYVCYSSADMNTWKFEGELMPAKPDGVYYRPHVVYNSKTKKYVLWYNWYPKLWNGRFGVAESKSPMGPFKIINDNVKVKNSNLGVGDFGLFVDDDGLCYLSYNTINGHKLSVEKLDKNYTASTLQNSGFITSNCEAGSMFKRKGVYYLLTDYTCCFCTQGSGARIYTAENPLDSFTYRQNINRYPGTPTPLLHDGFTRDNNFQNFTSAGNNQLEIWLEKPSQINQLNITQFTGDRNGQCGEVDNPLVHDTIEVFDFKISYFLNGEWKTLKTATNIKKEALLQQYQIDFVSVTAEKIIIKPVLEGNKILHLSEVIIEAAQSSPISRVFSGNGQPAKPIIPAQQGYVMETVVNNKPLYIWMGDLWGSATDNIKGHDFQYWSAPLEFYGNGLIKTLEWTDTFNSK